MKTSIGFVGAGHMGSALLKGLRAHLPAASIWVYDRHLDRAQDLASVLDIQVADSLEVLCRTCQILVLAVQPAGLLDLVSQLPVENTHLIVSVAAGITTAQISERLFLPVPVVRAMPNVPSFCNQGATGLFTSEKLMPSSRAAVEQLFDSVGISVWVEDESQMNIVTALSGSGPAYFLYWVSCLVETAVSLGLPEVTAKQLALQTARGAAELAQLSPDSLSELLNKITTAGGTTEAALSVLISTTQKDLIQGALEKATKRAQVLSSSAS